MMQPSPPPQWPQYTPPKPGQTAQAPQQQQAATATEEPLFPQDGETIEDAFEPPEESQADPDQEQPQEQPTSDDDLPELEPEEEPEEQDVPVDAAQGLLDYLSGLTEYLPDDVRTTYEDSEMKLRMEALRSRLKGQGGLHAIAERMKLESEAHAQGYTFDSPAAETHAQPADAGTTAGTLAGSANGTDTAPAAPATSDALAGTKQPDRRLKQPSGHSDSHVTEAEQMGLFSKKGRINPQQVESTFGYLESLTDQHPNHSIGVALKRKMHDIIEKLRGT
jgi:hypothetical protein